MPTLASRASRPVTAPFRPPIASIRKTSTPILALYPGNATHLPGNPGLADGLH
jgi:hypothetical protein